MYDEALDNLKSMGGNCEGIPIDNQPVPPGCPTLDELRHWREEVLAPELEQCMASASSEKDGRACHCALSRKLVARYAELSEREACGTMYDEALDNLKWMERWQCTTWPSLPEGVHLPSDMKEIIDKFLRSGASGNVTWPSLPEGEQLQSDTKEIIDKFLRSVANGNVTPATPSIDNQPVPGQPGDAPSEAPSPQATSKTTTRPPADAEAAKEKDGVAQLSLLLPTLLTLVRAWGC